MDPRRSIALSGSQEALRRTAPCGCQSDVGGADWPQGAVCHCGYCVGGKRTCQCGPFHHLDRGRGQAVVEPRCSVHQHSRPLTPQRAGRGWRGRGLFSHDSSDAHEFNLQLAWDKSRAPSLAGWTTPLAGAVNTQIGFSLTRHIVTPNGLGPTPPTQIQCLRGDLASVPRTKRSCTFLQPRCWGEPQCLPSGSQRYRRRRGACRGDCAA